MDQTVTDILLTDSYEKKLEMEKSLFRAAEIGDSEKLLNLLESGVSVEAAEFRRESYYSSKHAMTPLHVAAAEGHLECLQVLIKHGANLDAKDAFDRTALHVAAENGKLQCLQALLQAGANCCVPIVDTSSCKIDNPYIKGTTALHLAAKHNNSSCIKELINFGADYNAVDENGHTSLYIAAKSGHRECILTHLRHPRSLEILSLPSYDTSDTPLHFAIHHRLVDCVKELVVLGSDVNHVNCDGFSPLRLLCKNAKRGDCVDLEILKCLVLDGYNFDLSNSLKYTVDNSSLEHMTKFLIKSGADISGETIKKLLKRELNEYKNFSFLKYIVNSIPVLPHLNSIGLELISIRTHFPVVNYKKNSVWEKSTLPVNAEFNLVLDENDLYIEIYELDPMLDKIIIQAIWECKRYHLKEPLLSLVYERVVEELEDENMNFETCCFGMEFTKRGFDKILNLLKLRKQLWYENIASNPRTLQHHCRSSIRKCMGSSSLKQTYIEKLPLPEKLQSYILFEGDGHRKS